MSIDIYTDLVLRTAQFVGPLKSANDELRRMVATWANTTINVAVNYVLPDNAAVQRMLSGLRTESVNIPVQLVPMGGNIAAAGRMDTGMQAGRFGTNAATGGGSSVAITNGTKATDAQGFAAAGSAVADAASSVLSSSGITDAIKSFTGGVTDLRDEISDLARQFEAWSRSGRNGGGSSGGSGESGGAAAISPAAASPSRQQRRAEQRDRARANRNRSVADEAAGFGDASNGGGFGADAFNDAGHGGDSGRGGHSRRGPGFGGSGATGAFIRSHPSLSRLFGGLGLAYTLSNAMQSATELGDANYAPTGNVASLGTRQTINHNNAIRSNMERMVPLVGGMATGAGEFAGATSNWASGKGFVTEGTRLQYQAEQEDLTSETGFEARRSGLATAGYKDYNPVAAVMRAQQQRAIELEQTLTDAKYRQRENPGELNASGVRLRDAKTTESQAEADRERREASFGVTRAEGEATIDQRASNRRGFSSYLRSQHQYDRQAEMDDSIGAIDDRIDRRTTQVSTIADPIEKARQEKVLAAEVEAAKQEKAAETHEKKLKWALEDSAIITSTQAATLRASGNYYEADRREFEEAWKQKLATEQDANKRVLLERQKVAEESQRAYQRQEESRAQTRQARLVEQQTAGKSVTAAREAIENAAIDQGKTEGIVEEYIDPTTGERAGKWFDTKNGIDSTTGMPFTRAQQDKAASIDRDKRARLAEVEKQQRYGTEDIDRSAASKQGQYDGDPHGARQRERDAIAKRRLAEATDQSPEGKARRDAIQRDAEADRKQAERDKKDDLRRAQLATRQSQLRAEGRGQMAEAIGSQAEAAEELRSVRGDADLLPATLAKLKAGMEEQLVGRQRSETFGSVAEYANRNFQEAANSDQGAQAMLQQNIKQIGDALAGPANALQQAADMFIQKFQTFN
ncbi:MAG TPA: hypothetical protein VF595_06155 [Tepidisphaeraceae bacterium]|jgi:hypothetical protein